jgi:hypothetical protein
MLQRFFPKSETARPRPAPHWRPGLELLEDRSVPSVSTITSNFNGTAIPAGDTVWFNAVLKPSGLGSSPVTIRATGGTITSSAFTVSVPDAVITFTPGATAATATFDAASNTWDVNVPSTGLSGNTFLDGVGLSLPSGLAGGLKSVAWTENFSTDTPGVKLNWQWASAVYTSFSGDPSALGVKPVDSNSASQYKNSDHAGTPEAFKAFVVGGAMGGGGSNFTGSYSATASVTPDVQSSSLSGRVVDQNLNGLGGVQLTLTGTTSSGQSVYVTAYTDANGFYSFTSLSAGTYSIYENEPSGYSSGGDTPGTLGGTPGTLSVTGITVGQGQSGTGYDFSEIFMGS